MTEKKKEKEEKKFIPPKLTKFGRLKDLTRAKGSDRDDGGSPKTWDKGCP